MRASGHGRKGDKTAAGQMRQDAGLSYERGEDGLSWVHTWTGKQVHGAVKAVRGGRVSGGSAAGFQRGQPRTDSGDVLKGYVDYFFDSFH